jgi:hypothetical protein
MSFGDELQSLFFIEPKETLGNAKPILDFKWPKSPS